MHEGISKTNKVLQMSENEILADLFKRRKGEANAFIKFEPNKNRPVINTDWLMHVKMSVIYRLLKKYSKK